MRGCIMKKTFVLALLLLVGCDSTAEYRAKQPGASGVREIGQGYFQYDIENGTVTCREHRLRSEFSCWRNGK